MFPKKPFLAILLALAATAGSAETVTEYFLETKDCEAGQWPCLFYELNYNTEIAPADHAKWYAIDEDETYWREGTGPFSSGTDPFRITPWASTVHPLLVRRHFTLTEDDLEKINVGQVMFEYSYDENPVFWLNGTKIASATGWNDNDYATLRFSSTRKKLLHAGDNVLCVSLQQGGGSGHIDYGLRVIYDPTRTGIPAAPSDDDDLPAYNLLGQPLPHPASHAGIIIQKGKKTLHK